ncbi:MAG: cobalamin-independent methionine synthase II family protein [Chloroflexi bacterium]|nr:cobalamin-independent methionine synthase II family protein [Chloroflexota bacterium]
MQRSTDRILTSHVGSLPRPPDLQRMPQVKDRGEPYDAALFEACVKDMVAEVVRKQAEVGIDVLADGEPSKSSFTNYVKDRLSGLDGTNTDPYPGPPPMFPEYADAIRIEPGRVTAAGLDVRPLNTSRLSWKNFSEVERDIANLQSALDGLEYTEAFMPAVAVGQVLFMIPSTYYSSDQAYLYDLADVLEREYRAIVDAGFILQVDAPDVPMMRNRQLWNVPFSEYRKHLALSLEALNHALAGIPEDRIRFHVCWGNADAPHADDVPLKDIVDLVLTVRALAYSIEAANPRHAHEWEVWENVRLPDGKILIPGVIDSVTTFVEHPDLVAQRILQYARLVGRENLIAAPDCGFGTFSAWTPRVHPEIMWAKFRSLVEGARIASERLWGKRLG